jgi:hypothetical protein
MGKNFQILLSEQIKRDIMLSKQVKIDDAKTVCLTLGPYRNLTTLTAAIIALHPTCQVLNHACIRIFGNEELNFLLNYNSSKFDAFIKYAVFISTGGRRAQWGGSITLSHAFDHEEIRKIYRERYGDSLIKEKIECLFWKESLRTSNLIKQFNIDLGGIFKRNDKVKFLMPIRNPLDCAESNMRTGHMLIFPNLNPASSFEEVLDSIMKELLWFLDLQKKYPERFFYYFENDFNQNVLISLANFLRIYPDIQWINNAFAIFKIKKPYIHDSNKIKFYKDLVERYFLGYPGAFKKLLLFS